MIAIALEAWGVRAPGGDDEVGAINLGAQRSTVTYACTMSCWGGTGFAKLNLAPGEWRDAGDPRRYLRELAAHLWTGDPIAFAEALRLGIDARPAALLTTAVALSPALRDRLAERFGASVIDWYSLTETGPLAFACPRGEGYHLLAHDVHVEVIDPHGAPTSERGEVTVTGGRNPYVPLLRYRTGDFGRIDRAACACGEPTPRLVEGRPPVPLRARDGAPINTVDVARALRPFPLVQHALVQRADASVELTVRAAPGEIDLDGIRSALAELFGDVPLSLHVDPTLGDRLPGKVIPYRSELPLEE
jgi:phenylacetate-CoA ligase